MSRSMADFNQKTKETVYSGRNSATFDRKYTEMIQDVMPELHPGDFQQVPSTQQKMRDIASDLTAFENYSSFNISTIESVNVAESVHNRVNKGLVPSKNMRLLEHDDPILGLVPLEKSSKPHNDNPE